MKPDAEPAMRTLLIVLALALAACGSPPARGPEVLELRGPAWVADAAAGWDRQAEPLVLRATGRAPLAGDRQAAGLAAEAQARETIRAFVEEAVARLGARFRTRNASLLAPADAQALAADAPGDRDVAAAALAGVRLQGQWFDDETWFAWLALDTGEHLLPAYEAHLTARLAPLARELTPGDRQALREELAGLVAERQGR